jgi:type VI secretion system protein ImpF
MPSSNTPLLTSVLDRLLEDDLGSTSPVTRGRAQQLVELRRAVQRDLEALLNTHRCCRSPPTAMTELERSLVEYGVPDFLTANGSSSAAREQYRRSVEDVIRRFEPRFQVVKVSLLDDTFRADRTLRFRIEALMYVEPAAERVSFESLLDPALHSFTIVGSA